MTPATILPRVYTLEPPLSRARLWQQPRCVVTIASRKQAQRLDESFVHGYLGEVHDAPLLILPV